MNNYQSYYNTTHENPEMIKGFIKICKSQEELIQNYFLIHSEKDFSPDEIKQNLKLNYTPITSIRRAITNLTKRGVIFKTNKKKIGNFGRMTYTWQYFTQEKQLTLF